MNREIKFRGKRVDNGEWVYGYLLKTEKGTYIFDCDENGNTVYISRHPKKVILETVGQFTGLYDKNGKEIYENDFIKADSFDKKMLVVWRKDLSSFALSADGWMYDHYFGEGADPRYCIITGNIHENDN